MTQSFFLSCAWLALSIWLALRPRDLIVLIERSNRAKWEHASVAVIRMIGAVSAISIFLVLMYRASK
jgi:hypothetical protein